MWGKKDEPETPVAVNPTPPPAPVAPKPAPRPAPPVASSPAPALSSSQAQVGKSLHLKGEITGSEDLYIDGEVEGTVELKDNNLTIGPNGNVHADVQARSITILGRLRGNVRAGDKVEIRKTGSLEGDLATARIIIEDGAVFRGSIDILQPGREGDHKAVAQAAGQSGRESPAAAASVGGLGAVATPASKP